jgi:parvulin-like peptidyl-prolyl isomerase
MRRRLSTKLLQSTLFPVLVSVASVGLAQQPGAPAGAYADDSRIVISVDDQKMTSADVEKFINSLPPQYQAFYRGPGRAQLPQYLVQMKILLAESRKDHVADQPEVKEAIQIATDSILADAERRHLEKKVQVSDKEIEDHYEKHKAEYEQVHLRHIVVVTDDASVPLPQRPSHPAMTVEEARKKLEHIRKQAEAGTDFALLAEANSDDVATARAGGDLGYANRSSLLPPISKAAFSLQPGQISEVIGTPYGLELVKVDDRRTQPLSEVRQSLVSEIQRSKAGQALQQIISQHQITVDEAFFSAKPLATAAASSSAPH